MRLVLTMIAGTLTAACLALLPITTTPAGESTAGRLALVDRWSPGGEGGWDYLTLDATGRRLFLSRGSEVDVIDTVSGRTVGSIPHTAGVHGIALAPDLRRGYTSNGRSDTVTAFNMDTLQTLQEAPVSGHNPDAILYEPTGRHVYTFNGRSSNVTVLDAATLAIVQTLPLPDKPEFAVTDGKGSVFVNIESDPGQVVVIDARTLKVKATWPLPGCASPSGLALDDTRHRLFSVCDRNVMAVTNAASGAQIARVHIGAGPDAAAFDPGRGLALSSNGEGSLTVVARGSGDDYHVAYTLMTRPGARTMALDANSGTVYLACADLDPLPQAASANPRPRPTAKPGIFTILAARYR